MTFQSITPNLMVKDMSRSVEFYRDVLGFQIEKTVPDNPPYVFAWMKRDSVDVFLNRTEGAEQESLTPARPGGVSMYVILTGIDELFASVQTRATVVMPMTKQFYGMREFAITDPDGYLLTFAERE